MVCSYSDKIQRFFNKLYSLKQWWKKNWYSIKKIKPNFLIFFHLRKKMADFWQLIISLKLYLQLSTKYQKAFHLYVQHGPKRPIGQPYQLSQITINLQQKKTNYSMCGFFKRNWSKELGLFLICLFFVLLRFKTPYQCLVLL